MKDFLMEVNMEEIILSDFFSESKERHAKVLKSSLYPGTYKIVMLDNRKNSESFIYDMYLESAKSRAENFVTYNDR
jgi:hypothetical protein